ncbi:MAG: hypothetical protein NTZ21_04135 [Actinobacteria bacterium]|nr:hypothetical protein [Actinomycetota bacterium]
MTLLEDRLAAAGDQLDDLIENQLGSGLGYGGRLDRRASHRRSLTVAAAVVALIAGGLSWMATGRGPTDGPVSDDVATTLPAPSPATTFEPGDPGCGIEQTQLVVVASATDSQGRRVDYRVADLPIANAEQLHFSDGGWSGGCDGAVPLSALHPSGAWTNVAAETSAAATEVYVHGKLPAGSGPHEVTLSTGDVVPVTPTADGWFLATAVIQPVDDVDDVATAPVSPSPTAPSTPASPAAAPPTTLPIADRPPLAIGESVMLGAAPQLAAGGFVVNADESRQGETTAEIVGQYRASGQIGKIIVIQVGTNGPVSQETYDEIMSYLPPEEVEQVIFLTVSAPRGWIEPNNALIWALQTRYSNVKVLDWAGFVASEQVPGLAGDGIHLGTEAAKQFYANYIFDFSGRRDLVRPLPE